MTYKEFRERYAQLSTADIDGRMLKKLDDVAITKFAKTHKLEPKLVKSTVSVAIIGTGSIMAAFAIKQLTAGVEELRNNFKLADISKPLSYEALFYQSLSRILLLKSSL